MNRARSVPSMFANNQDDILARSSVETWVIKGVKGNVDCCKKCEGKVFEAEKLTTASGDWYHKNCFRCGECNRLLDSLTNNDGADGGLYCKKCYRVKYGPETRSSDIDHKLIDLSIIKLEDASKNCPRCGGAVFDNESVICGKVLLHKKCASCFLCEKKLNSNSIFKEKDEFYCDGCYRRKFSPCGYRGAGTTSWVDAASGDTLRHAYEAY